MIVLLVQSVRHGRLHRGNYTPYKFRYPNTWTLVDSPNTNKPNPAAGGISFGGVDEKIEVHTQATEDCTTLVECAEKHPYNFNDSYEAMTQPEATTVSSEPALTLLRKRTDSGMWRYRVYYMLHGNTFFTVYSIVPPGGDEIRDNYIKTIVSTFEFLK